MTTLNNGAPPISRNSQSFFVLQADQLLQKLQWDLEQLEQLRWDEDLGNDWRQIVSYKAMDCVMSIWHLAEWFAQDIWATQPIEAACAFLEIPNHGPYSRISLKQLRAAAVRQCPELDICRIIAIASKHYEVEQNPRPEVTTRCYLSSARRGDEPFSRQVMWLSVKIGTDTRELCALFHTCFVYWSHLAYVSRPGTTWKTGDHLPDVPLPFYVAPPSPQQTASRSPSIVARLKRLVRRT